MSQEMTIHPGVTMTKDPETGKKTYRGKFTVGYGDGLRGPVRELLKVFDRRNRSQKWSQRVRDRYLRSYDYGNDCWRDGIKERLKILHPEDGDLILIETTQQRRDVVLANIQQIAEHIDANALFLVVGGDEHMRYADPVQMRKIGWVRSPLWWIRKLLG